MVVAVWLWRSQAWPWTWSNLSPSMGGCRLWSRGGSQGSEGLWPSLVVVLGVVGVALAVVAQGPVHLVLETAAGGVLEHELSVPLAAPLPEGVAFLRYGGGVSEAVEAAGRAAELVTTDAKG